MHKVRDICEPPAHHTILSCMPLHPTASGTKAWSGSVGVQDCASAPEKSAMRLAVAIYPRDSSTGKMDHSNGWLTESPSLSLSSMFMICFHHSPGLPCIALHCIELSEHQVPSANDAGGDRCVRCVDAKSNMSHEVGMRPGRWASHNYVIAGP